MTIEDVTKSDEPRSCDTHFSHPHSSRDLCCASTIILVPCERGFSAIKTTCFGLKVAIVTDIPRCWGIFGPLYSGTSPSSHWDSLEAHRSYIQ